MVEVKDFSRRFLDFKNALPYKLNSNILEFELVGSTFHNDEGKDYDVVVLVDSINEMVDGLELLGWDNESDWGNSHYPTDFVSMRRLDFNLLLTEEVEFFQRMRNSSKVIRKVQDMSQTKLSRGDVCDIYSLILYGHQADAETK